MDCIRRRAGLVGEDKAVVHAHHRRKLIFPPDCLRGCRARSALLQRNREILHQLQAVAGVGKERSASFEASNIQLL